MCTVMLPNRFLGPVARARAKRTKAKAKRTKRTKANTGVKEKVSGLQFTPSKMEMCIYWYLYIYPEGNLTSN